MAKPKAKAKDQLMVHRGVVLPAYYILRNTHGDYAWMFTLKEWKQLSVDKLKPGEGPYPVALQIMG